MSGAVADALARPLRSLRISVTDRCNMRCHYCMPEDHYVWLPRASILTYEEIARITGVFAGLGVNKVRLTGGEPLLRRDLTTLIALLRRDARITDLALTTNGLLLGSHARRLREAGLGRVTVSLDSLRPERQLALSHSPDHADVLAGIAAARGAGFGTIRINTVVIRGFNDDELAPLIEFAKSQDAEIRFIEYMDVGGATRWSRDAVVSQREMLALLTERYGPIEPLPGAAGSSVPAERFRLPDGSTFGIIASVTAPFCRSCDRSRLTADGTWLLCLYADHGIDLREPLRGGLTDDELATLIARRWGTRTDRGAASRRNPLALDTSGVAEKRPAGEAEEDACKV